jgi:hypothetical protein
VCSIAIKYSLRIVLVASIGADKIYDRRDYRSTIAKRVVETVHR